MHEGDREPVERRLDRLEAQLGRLSETVAALALQMNRAGAAASERAEATDATDAADSTVAADGASVASSADAPDPPDEAAIAGPSPSVSPADPDVPPPPPPPPTVSRVRIGPDLSSVSADTIAPHDAGGTRERAGRPAVPATKVIAPAAGAGKGADGAAGAAGAGPPPVAPPANTSDRPPAARRSFEELVGGRGLAIVGAIVIVIGASLAVALAVQAGLWAAMSPGLRCLLIALFGAGLVVAGEVVLRRAGRPAAIGLFSAGLGVLWVDAFAAWRGFGVVSDSSALLLMIAASAVGVALAWRAGSSVVGVLSLVFGYATPFLVRDRAGGHPAELGVFLTALLVTGLVLSMIRPRSFRGLRFVVIVGNAAVGGLWLAAIPGTAWGIGLVFVSGWWAAVLAESTVAALRRQTSRTNISAVVLATGLAVAAFLVLLQPGGLAGVELRGVFLGSMAACCLLVVFQFGSGIDAIRRRPTRAIEALASTLFVLAGALVAVGIALQFDAATITIAWLVLGLATIEIGRRVGAVAMSAYGLVSVGLALVRIGTLDFLDPALAVPVLETGAVQITRWTLLAAAGIAGLVVAAIRWPPRPALGGPLMVLAVIFAIGLEAITVTGLARPFAFAATAVAGFELSRLPWRERRFLAGAGFGALVLAGLVLAGELPAAPYAGWRASAIEPDWRSPASAGWAIVVVGWALAAVASAARCRSLPVPVRAAAWWSAVAGIAVAAVGAIRGPEIAAVWGILAIGLSVLRGTRAHGWPTRIVHVHVIATLAIAAASVALGDMLVAPASDGIVVSRAIAFVVGAAALGFAGRAAWSLAAERTDSGSNSGANSGSGADLARDSDASAPWPVTAVETTWWGGFALIVAAFLLRDDLRSIAAPLETLPIVIGILAVPIAAATWFGWRRAAHAPPAPVLAGPTALVVLAAAWLVVTFIRVAAGDLGTVPAVRNPDAASAAAVLVGGAIALACMFRNGSERVSPGGLRTTHLRALGVVTTAAVCFAAVSLELVRVWPDDTSRQLAALSVWWGLFGVALVVLGFRFVSAGARRSGLVLLVATTAKVLLVDLAGTEDIWRVVSLVATGLLLVGASIVYSRLAARLQVDGSRPTNSPSPPGPSASNETSNPADENADS